MKIEFDPAKNAKNIWDRGRSFELVAEFDFDSALIVRDDRREYGEVRFRAVGRLGEEIAAVVFTMRDDTLRVISLRIASRKERRQYEKAEGESRAS